MDGTLVELRQVANAVGRKDVVEILNNAMNDEVGGKWEEDILTPQVDMLMEQQLIGVNIFKLFHICGI